MLPREPWERFQHLNERIDQAVVVQAHADEDGNRPVLVFAIATGPMSEPMEIRVEPSRLLYGIDRSAYIDVLKTVGEVSSEIRQDEEREIEAARAKDLRLASAPLSRPITEVVPVYRGRLAALRPVLEGFLSAEGWQASKAPPDEKKLSDSLLATADQNIGLDWKQREGLQASLKVAFRRVLVQFGSDPENARRMSERLVTWFRIQVPESAEVLQRTN